MSLREITGERDLTFSEWHRNHLPEDCSWIDIDCCQFCKYCQSPLALIELTKCCDRDDLEERCRRKVAAITERIGIKLNIPVFKIAHWGVPLELAAIQRVGQPEIVLYDVEGLTEFIDRLHDCEFCREHRSGRFAKRSSKCSIS